MAAPPPEAPPAKRTPISLEDLMRVREQEAAATAKPVFLTKKDREALALQKLQEKRDAELAKQQDSEAARRAFQQKAYEERQRGMTSRGGGGSSLPLAASSVQGAATSAGGTQTPRLASASSSSGTSTPTNSGVHISAQGEHIRETTKPKSEQEKEIELIRKQYLGDKDRHKKTQKVSERYKFNFDWKPEDDTSRGARCVRVTRARPLALSADANALYQERLQLRPLFGRGFIAGVDAKEQVKKHRERLEQVCEKACARVV
jgi:ATP-dependent RNA helicase DDX23/PRP28